MPRGDGRLTDDLDPQERGPQDACGVFGVWAPEEEVAKLTYFGLFALQHRGQEAAGIAVSDGSGVVVYKDLGLVSQVFDEPTLASLRGHLAIGHTRYSTTGGSNWENAQPTIRATTADAPATALCGHEYAGGHEPRRPRGEPDGTGHGILGMRDFMDTMRASGNVGGGPPPLTLANRNAFAKHLDTWLARRPST